MNHFALRLVAWEMTRACNLACVHCRAGACSEADPEQLTLDEGKILIDGIREVGTPILIMTGGEPLLRPDFYELATYGIERGMRVVLATNGTLVDRATAKKISKVGIARVSISIDGPDSQDHDAFRKIPGAFDAAMSGIANLRAAAVPVQINTTLTKRNREKLPEIMQLAKSVDASAFHVFLLVPTGRAREMSGEEMGPEEYEETLRQFYHLGKSCGMETKATCAPQYYRIMRQEAKNEGIEVSEKNFGMNAFTRGCLAGLSFVFVSHRGNLQPCGYFDVKAGSIRERTFQDLWKNAVLFNELRNFRRLEGKCGKCNYVRFCGGCRARAYEATGRYMSAEPYCAYQPPSQAPERHNGTHPQTEN